LVFCSEEYELLDFGGGRKLERFGAVVLDRPCPVAKSALRAQPKLWDQTTARYARTRGGQGAWTSAERLPDPWIVRRGALTFELKAAPFGHVGLFPEQTENWDWIGESLAETGRRGKVLNLFAYTGGSTLAAAAAGAEVVHVDAAKNSVAWARRNAKRSGLAEAPIRWIVDDAGEFVAREIRRGSNYDGVILDPPSYGHDPRGRAWRIERDLPPLLRACVELTGGKPNFLLLSCHSEEWSADRLIDCLRHEGLSGREAAISAVPLHLGSRDGRTLSCGVAVRVLSSLSRND
jgi:23S rRNA (cytosine1962-C5)-methyltransferase